MATDWSQGNDNPVTSWFQDVAHHFWNPTELPGAALRAAEVPVKAVGTAISRLGEADRWLYSKEVLPVSAGGLFINPASKDFLNIGESWKDAPNVSPAQAMAGNPVFIGVPFVGPMAQQPGSPWGTADRRAQVAGCRVRPGRPGPAGSRLSAE